MTRLLKFEFRKLFRQKSFYICGAVLVGLLLITTVSINFLMSLNDAMVQTSDGSISMGIEGYMNYNGLQMLSAALSECNFSIILAIFLSLFICGDYTNDTLKNVIAKGYGRVSIYASKFIVSLAAVSIYVVICWLTSFISGSAFWGIGTLSGDATPGSLAIALFTQLLLVYAYTAVFFFLCVLLRKTGGSIAIGILAPLVLSMILSLLDALFHEKTFQLTDYWLDSLLVQSSGTFIPSDILTRGIVCSVIYLVLFAVGGHLIGRRHQV